MPSEAFTGAASFSTFSAGGGALRVGLDVNDQVSDFEGLVGSAATDAFEDVVGKQEISIIGGVIILKALEELSDDGRGRDVVISSRYNTVALDGGYGIDIVSGAGDINLIPNGFESKTLVELFEPSNEFEINGYTNVVGGISQKNSLFAVSGSGATQMSTSTIVLQAGATAQARKLSSVGDSLITIISGKDATVGAEYTHELADGVHGQVRTFSVGAKSGAGTTLVITPTHASFTTVTLNVDTSGQCVTLVFTDEWHKISGSADVAFE
jgi:hypothetical protein